jgi:Iap family predicted aminopeptidase
MKRALPIIFALPIAAAASAQSDPATVERIVDIGKNKNQVMRTLKGLTDIGPRLTGSQKLSKAQHWAMAKFRSYGLKNVHLEKWGDVPVGFERGDRQVGRMVSPFVSEIGFTTQCWMPGTEGKVLAEAVLAPTTAAEATSKAAELKGKWVVMNAPSTMRGPAAGQEDLKKALADIGIAGIVYGAADERVHSSGNWRDKTFEKRPTTVEILVRKSDHARIVRNINFGRRPTLEFDIENKWFKGPIDQYNVVADLVGTEKPDEIVIVCGHLDSWNSPGSQGTCDNGTGTSVAIEAARILSSAKAKPKRTIRFVLWSGEEQGLHGSRGYVITHKNELDKISAVLNDDGGTNYQGGYVGLETMRPMMEAAFAPTKAAFPELEIKFNGVASMPQGGSSDHAPFNWEGVPGFFTIESGKADYGRVWHTQFDQYKEAVPQYLVQSSTNHAVVAYNLACAPTMLPRGPKPPPRQAKIDLNHNEAIGADHMYQDHDHTDDYWLDRIDRLPRWVRQILPAIAR